MVNFLSTRFVTTAFDPLHPPEYLGVFYMVVVGMDVEAVVEFDSFES